MWSRSQCIDGGVTQSHTMLLSHNSLHCSAPLLSDISQYLRLTDEDTKHPLITFSPPQSTRVKTVIFTRLFVSTTAQQSDLLEIDKASPNSSFQGRISIHFEQKSRNLEIVKQTLVETIDNFRFQIVDLKFFLPWI